MYVPAIGHTLARDLMPQIKDPHDFLDELELQGISHGIETLDPSTLKSTQSEFDANKVYDMMSDHGEKRPIITSQDGYVLDGHHRWLEAANKGEKVEGHVCHCGILELLHHAKRYVKLGIGKLNEELEAKIQSGGIEHKDFGPMLDSFVSFASDHLGLKSLPNIRFKDGAKDTFNSFAAYTPGKKHTIVSISNRHPMDVFRSVAHELVHQKQDEDGKLYPGAGETGSDIEDEANFMAGRIMRHWAKANPHHFGLAYVAEDYKPEALVVGGPMSGKDRLARMLHEEMGYIVHSMDAYDFEAIKTQVAYMNNPTIYFVDTTNDVSKLRNEARAEKGQRVLAEGVRFEKYTKAQDTKEQLRTIFKDFHVIDNSIQEASNEVKVKVAIEAPKPAAKKKSSSSSSSSSSKGKKKVVRKSPEQVKMDMEAQKQRHTVANEKSKQKFQQDNEEAKRQHERETQEREIRGAHYQMRAGEMEMRIQQIRDSMSRLQPQGSNYKKIHSAMHKQIKGAMLGMRNWQKQALNAATGTPKPEPSKGVAKPSVNEAFEKMIEHAGEWGTDELRKNYQNATPGQEVTQDITNQPSNSQDGISTDSIGASTITNLPPWPYSVGVGIGGYSGLAEHIVAWSKKPETFARFHAKYGDQAGEKIFETAKFMNEQKVQVSQKTLRKIKESFDRGVGLMGTVPNQGKEEVDEEDILGNLVKKYGHEPEHDPEDDRPKSEKKRKKKKKRVYRMKSSLSKFKQAKPAKPKFKVKGHKPKAKTHK